jgi:DNA-binding HxlR family transcriptional regulator
MEILGERWTFLILRESFYGVRRFSDMQRNLGIARNILSARLQTLVARASSSAAATRRSPSASSTG